MARASHADWRDAASYGPLLHADRSLFAWEWLRRDPHYVDAASAAFPAGDDRQMADRFGLVGFEDPNRAVPDARPLWSAAAYPYVLRIAGGEDGAADDRFDIGRFAAIATLVACEGGEHLLLCDGLRMVRLDAPPGTFGKGPVCPRYRLEGIAAAERPLLTLRRFLALCRGGRFSGTLHGAQPRARRWILMLRAWDALAAGADQRDIARELLSRTAAEPRWRSREPSVRSQAQRLVRSARAFSAGGYRALLG